MFVNLVRQNLFRYDTKNTNDKNKTVKLYFIKFKRFYASEDTIKKMNRQQ